MNVLSKCALMLFFLLVALEEVTNEFFLLGTRSRC